MCSIFGLMNLNEPARFRDMALAASRKQRHRGPDWSGLWTGRSAILAHERLSIVDVEHGAQPLVAPESQLALAVNGEIYNHRELRHGLADHPFRTGSDCEVILPLYERERPEDFLNRLNGIFAFVLVDDRRETFLVARDPIGVIPLYWGRDAEGRWVFGSELKALVGICDRIEDFPPGHYLDGRDGEFRPYHQPGWQNYDAVRGLPADPERLRHALTDAVQRQLMGDVPYGALLSGGLDSSLIASIAHRFSERRVETGGRERAWWPRLHTFAIGLQGSPDLDKAREAAEFLGTVHHGFRYAVQEGIDALQDVIHHIETFDVTTVRASTPMFLLARRIRSMGIKMVLTGEGSDEIFGGYLYFHKAPSARAFHEELVRKLNQLHRYDCLRANKSMAAWGVEARVPFLDREFLDVAMWMDAEHKRCGPGRLEKHVLRSAFDGALPDAVLWRQKEQFSDGVGYGWIDGLKAHADARVTDADLARAASDYPEATPTTKEGLLYRRIFEELFGSAAVATVPSGPSVACSTPAALEWDASFRAMADPSGRAVRDVHQAGYGADAPGSEADRG